MDVWPVGLSTGCFHQQSILTCLKAIKLGGFDLIEVCSVPGHLDYQNFGQVRDARTRIRELDLKAQSFHAPFAAHIDISSPCDSIRKNALEEISVAAEAAAFLEATYFVIHPGPEHEFGEDERHHIERLKHTTESLFQIAGHCRRLGIRCVLENKLPHLVFSRIDDLVFILDATVMTRAGICLDTGHAHLARALESMVAVLAPFLCMVHAHDNRARADEHLPPGEGTIDWVRLTSGLKAAHFNGPVVLELGSSGKSGEIMKRAGRSKQFLQDVFRKT
jgi:sugar phosphate isomerase/epimerase